MLLDELTARAHAAFRKRLPEIERALGSDVRTARIEVTARFKVDSEGEVQVRTTARTVIPAASMAPLECGFDGGRLIEQGRLSLEPEPAEERTFANTDAPAAGRGRGRGRKRSAPAAE